MVASVPNLLFTAKDTVTDAMALFAYSGSSSPTRIGDSSASGSPLKADPFWSHISAEVVGSTAYFVMADTTGRTSALWSYDGTTVTQLTSSTAAYVYNGLDAESATASTSMLGSYNGQVVFSQGNLAGFRSGGRETATLSLFDPGTGTITQPTTPNGGINPHDFVNLNGNLYFIATDTITHFQAVYSYDGSAVSEVYNLHPSDFGGVLFSGAVTGPLVAFNGHLYFGSPGPSVYELTSTDPLSNSATGADANDPSAPINAHGVELIVANSHLYYLAEFSGVYSVDAQNHVLSVLDSNVAIVFNPVDYSAKLYFSALDPSSQTPNLYASTGGAASVVVPNESLTNLLVFGAAIYASDGTNGGLATFNGSSVGRLAVPNTSGDTPLVVVPFAATRFTAAAVADTTPPTLTVTGAPFNKEATSAAGAAVTFPVTVNDNVDGTSDPITYKESASVVHSGDTFGLGTHTILVSTQDAAGNPASTSFRFTVRDTTAPTLTVSSAITQEATGASGAAVTFAATASDAVDGSADVVSLQEGTTVVQSGDVFGIGSHTITASVQDAAGNLTSDTFSITVQDTTAPTLALPSSITREASGASGAAVTFAATASDAVDGSADVVSFQEGTAVVQSGDVFGIGSHTITASVQDAAGNLTSDTISITVQDTTPPTLTVPSSITREATGTSGAAVTFAASASDVVDGSADAVSFREGTTAVHSGDVFGLGRHTITALTQDAAGNPASAAFTITIQDTTAPTLTVPSTITREATSLAGAPITFSATVSDVADGTSDPIIYREGTAVVHSGDVFARGSHTIVATAQDTVGNVSSGNFTIKVQDTTPPVLSVGAVAGDDVVSGTEIGQVVTLAGTAAGAEDGQVVSLALTTPDGTTTLQTLSTTVSGEAWHLDLAAGALRPYADGPYVVTADVSDASGNHASEAHHAFQIAANGGIATRPGLADGSNLFGTTLHDASGITGTIAELYEGLLGRAPDPLGLEAWTQRVGAGASLIDVARSFLDSAEFSSPAHAAASDSGFVQDIYATVLHRAAEPGGLAYWTSLLGSGVSRAEAALDIAISAEHQLQTAPIFASGIFAPDPAAGDAARLYYAVLGRAPDAAGLGVWTSALKGGLSESAMAQALLTSGEYGLDHPPPGSPVADGTVVGEFYANALGRAPSASDLGFWQSQLAGGASRADVAVDIGESAEAKLHHLADIELGWHLA